VEAERINSVRLGQPGKRSIALHRVVIGLLAIPGLFFVASGFDGLINHTVGGGPQLAIGLILLSLVELYRRSHLRQIKAVAIHISGGRLAVDDPVVLRRPIELELANIRVAATDNGTGKDDGFPVYGYPDGPLADRVRDHLVGKGRYVPLRFLHMKLARPNVILLFERPVVMPRARRTAEHGARRSEALGGIALTVGDTEQARRLFDAHGLRGRIREDDVERLGRINSGEIVVTGGRSMYEIERRRAAWAAVFSTGGALFVPFLELWGFVLAYLAWKEGFRWQAVVAAILGVAVLGVHIWALSQSPVPDPARFVIGAVITIFIFARWGRHAFEQVIAARA
jgi:hypothetical protein